MIHDSQDDNLRNSSFEPICSHNDEAARAGGARERQGGGCDVILTRGLLVTSFQLHPSRTICRNEDIQFRTHTMDG